MVVAGIEQKKFLIAGGMLIYLWWIYELLVSLIFHNFHHSTK